MNTSLVMNNGVSYLEVLPGAGAIETERDALDLVAACWENETKRVLLPVEVIGADFFDLKTGLAGALMLKLSNYQIRAAALIPPERIGQGHFYEMVLETNRGDQFRVFQNKADALHWLTGD